MKISSEVRRVAAFTLLVGSAIVVAGCSDDGTSAPGAPPAPANAPVASDTAAGNPGSAASERPAQPAPTNPAPAEPDDARVGLLVRLEAKAGKEAEVAAFARSGLEIVQQEPGTTSWFAVRLGASRFAIFDTFADEAGRQAHLAGRIPAALAQHGPELLAQDPVVEPLDVIATKRLKRAVTVGLLVRLQVKPGSEGVMEGFLAGGRDVVAEEPGTTSWFAVRLAPATFGIFDAFPEAGAREAHLGGRIPAALAAKGDELLSAAPTIERVDVLAAKLSR